MAASVGGLFRFRRRWRVGMALRHATPASEVMRTSGVRCASARGLLCMCRDGISRVNLSVRANQSTWQLSTLPGHDDQGAASERTEASPLVPDADPTSTADTSTAHERAEAELAAAFVEPGADKPSQAKRAPRLRGRRGGRSTIEDHPDRARIERDLALGKPLSKIAKKYGVSKDAAWRHKSKLPPQLKAALAAHALAPAEDLEKLRIEEGDALLSNLAAQRARLLIAQDAALEAEQFGLVAQLAGGIHRNIELVGKYLGEFAQHHHVTSVSILVSPEYLTLRNSLIRALAPFPAARQAVAAVLHQAESAGAQRTSKPLLDGVPYREAAGAAASA